MVQIKFQTNRLSLLIRLIFCLSTFIAVPAHAARLALIIGNSAYPNDALRNPVNDARAMEQKLGSLDFKVERIDNFKRDQIGRILTGFSGRIKPGDEVVVFYAGHGVQIKGINYLPAVDAKIESEEDVPLNSLNLNALMDRIDESKAGLKLLFLDACRNNPYARSFRSLDRGLARVSNAPSGTLIHFATRPGSVADDGRGANGLYTTHLLKHIDTPGLPVELMLKRVAASVAEETKGQQEPWIEGSIRGDFFFKPAVPEPVISPVLVSPAEIERQAWEAVRASNNLAGYSAFLSEYPNGPYSGAARVAKASIPDPVTLANERDTKVRAEAERLATVAPNALKNSERQENPPKALETANPEPETKDRPRIASEAAKPQMVEKSVGVVTSFAAPKEGKRDTSLFNGLRSLLNPNSPSVPTSDWSWPMAGKVSQRILGEQQLGLSIQGVAGDTVFAVGDGKVLVVSTVVPGATMIMIKHPDGIFSTYSGAVPVVKPLESVSRGQRIGEVSNGRLGFSMSRAGQRIDPLSMLPSLNESPAVSSNSPLPAAAN
jgi:uncharacterized caspase-like protein